MSKIKVILKKTTENAKIVEIEENKTSFQNFYDLLDCATIETLSFQDLFSGEIYVVLLDEEGKFNGKHENTILFKGLTPIDVICGDFCIAKVEGEEIVGVDERKVTRILELLNKKVSMLVIP